MRSVGVVRAAGSADRVRRDGIPPSPLPARIGLRWGFLEWFAIAQSALPAALFIPGSQAGRLPLRIAPFALSLLAFTWWWIRPGRGLRSHPSGPWLLLAVFYLTVMILAPMTSSVIAGVAHVMLYTSVLAPVFWVPRLVGNEERLRRVLGILLVCSGINAMVGVLQVYDPDRWMPPEFSRIVTTSTFGLNPVTFVGPDGFPMIRPPGLFDAPGGVCGPGMVAAWLGVIFAMSPIRAWEKIVAMLFAIAGMAALYLSHVRAAFVVLIGMMLIYLLTLVIQKRPIAVTIRFVVIVGAVAAVALSLAVVLAGPSVSERFLTLFEDPLEVYYESRGQQVQFAFTNLLLDYPLGAGLGLWGMIQVHFGNPISSNSPSIWVEVQPSAWVIDGGIFLLMFYAVALLVTSVRELKIVRSGGRLGLRTWAAPIFALNAGTLGLMFGFTPFTTQIGLQYWFLVGLLHGATQAGGAAVDERVHSR